MAWPMLTRYDRCVLESMLRCDTVSPTPGSVVYCLAASQSILLADEDLYRTRSVIRLPNGDQALGTSIEHTHTRHLSATIPSLPSALARTHARRAVLTGSAYVAFLGKFAVAATNGVYMSDTTLQYATLACSLAATAAEYTHSFVCWFAHQ